MCGHNKTHITLFLYVFSGSCPKSCAGKCAKLTQVTSASVAFYKVIDSGQDPAAPVPEFQNSDADRKTAAPDADIGPVRLILRTVALSLHTPVLLPEHQLFDSCRIVSDKACQDTQDHIVSDVIFVKGIVVSYYDIACIRDVYDPVKDIFFPSL
jgi:hypothetical protein